MCTAVLIDIHIATPLPHFGYLSAKIDDISLCSLYLEEIRGLPEAHLPAADHVDGVLECFVLGELRAVDRDSLVLQTRLA
jgi:hypothetical protein